MKHLSYTLSILCLLLSSSFYAQTGIFKIQGNMKEDYEGETIVIDVVKERGFPQTYSGKVKDGTFSISIDNCISCDTLAKLRLGENARSEELLLWLDDKNIFVDVGDDGKIRITGTKLNNRYQQYRDSIEYYYEILAPHIAEVIGKTSITYDTRSEEYRLDRNLGGIQYEFIKENIRNPIGIYLFHKLIGKSTPIALYKEVNSSIIETFNAADERIRLDPAAIKQKERAEKDIFQETQRKKLPESKITDIDAFTVNKKVKKLSTIISESDSEYFLLDFWASWCGPCIAEIPGLKDVYTKYNQKGLEIIAISIDDSESSWKEKLNQLNTPWVNILFDKDKMSLDKLEEKYVFSSIPYSLLVDKSGKIVSTKLPKDNERLGKILDQLLSAE